MKASFVTLDKDFNEKMRELLSGDQKLASLNGFADGQLNYSNFIDNFIDKQTVADASIDGNANVGTKDIVSLESEMSKPHSKLLAYNKIYYEMKKEYGKEAADKWLELDWDGWLYMHDASSTSFKPYCYAYDLEDLVNKGLYFIENFNAQPPKHLTTYTDFVGEFVSYASNRSSGAVGLPSFLVYSYYFWKKDVEEGYATKDPNYYARQEFQRIVYKLNQPYLRLNQSAFTNFSIFDRHYYESLFGGKTFPDGSYMIEFTEEFMEYQKLFMEVVSEIRSQNLMTFPVLTFSLLKIDGEWQDLDMARWANRHNMKWGDSNFFVSSDITSLSNCCRLVSDIEDMGYFNSLGGTALEVGSVKVSTVNLARIAYEVEKDDYIEKLNEILAVNMKALDRVRHIIKRNVDKGLLPNYNHGLIDLDNQYSTIGIIGVFEMLEKYGMIEEDKLGNTLYTEEGLKWAEDVLQAINDFKTEWGKDKEYKTNVEQVPAERAASVLMEKDRLFFPEESYRLPLYGNQWIPLGVKTTLDEKIRLSGILDKACGGGSIAHINLDAPITDEEIAWDLLNKVSDAGVVYFAFNLRINSCKNNHGFYGEVCPYCGEEKATSYQRIVGFLVPEKTYSKERKAEFALREWATTSDICGL